MSKVDFIRVEGYEHYYCHVVNGEHEIKVTPILGIYVDRKHSTVSVLDINGLVHKLGVWPTAYNAMKSPDGVFSFCGCWFDNQAAWQEFIRSDQAQAKAEAEAELEAADAGTIIDRFYDRFNRLIGDDMDAAQSLLKEFGVAQLCKLKGKDFDAFNARLTELGYGDEFGHRGCSQEVGITRKTPEVKTHKPKCS